MRITTQHLDWEKRQGGYESIKEDSISLKEAREEMVKRIDMLLYTQEGREKIGKILGCKIES